MATTGLVMDIVGIVLLFKNGAIGGKWIDDSVHRTVLESSDLDAQASNERRAIWRAWCGLGLAVMGFVLQLVAQWL